jgi:hypothetical protein
MENTKLFQEAISDKLYKNIINFAKEIHDQKISSDKIRDKMNTTDKLSRASAFTSIGLTLGTIATIAVNYYTNSPDIYRVAVDTMLCGGIASLAAITLSLRLNKKVGQLESEYLDASYRNHMNDVLRYGSFESDVVADLKVIGIDIERKKIMNVDQFMKLRDMDVKNPNYDSELKTKTTEFVKSLMDEYTKPEVVKKIKKNTP